MNPYTVLKVDVEASQRQIRDAYLSGMRTSHPDARSADDPVVETTVQELVEAYDLLRDPARRSAYDQRTAFRHEPRPIRVWVAQRRSPGPPPIQAGPVRWHS
ncbi:hypothetical protein ASG74_07455 [Knoellia sp. Soil729]|nr:hypothetical protein ASG74_07455 [Knoellia sp. Soil729]